MCKSLNTSSLYMRCRALLFAWGFVGLCYGFSAWSRNTGHLIPYTSFDAYIGFNPHGIWFYLSFFVWIPLAYLFAPLARLPYLQYGFILCGLLCGICFTVYPTYCPAPNYYLGHDWSSRTLHLLMQVDTRRNCLPSLHAALSWLCWWALTVDQPRRWYKVICTIWVLAITYSIVETGQHRVLDTAAGIALAALMVHILKKFLGTSV